MMSLVELDHRLTFGPALRAQRLAEAVLVITALLLQDERFAGAALVSALLQALSPRLALVGLLVALARPAPKTHMLGDLYFDLEGSRGASIVSAVAMALALALIVIVGGGVARTAGWLLLTPPAASFLMAPTLGFCAGCWIFVMARDVLRRLLGKKEGGFDGQRDLALDRSADRA